MASPIQEQRPYLSKIINLQKSTSKLDLLLHKQISGDILHNEESIALIDIIINENNTLRKENILSDTETIFFDGFNNSLKRLKLALIYYKGNRISDSSSSSTEELFEIIDENIKNINKNINGILSTVMVKISKSDNDFVQGTKYIKEILIIFIILTLTGTLSFIFFLNRTILKNLNNLIHGTVQLGEGDLEWRVKDSFDDEFGRLNTAFNEMAKKINDSQKKVLSQTEEIKTLAYHDSLTKLPNRIAFLDKLNQELAWAERHNENLGVLYIDLDDFKLVNDSFGHDIGDIFLREVAERLMQTSRRSDTIARLSGDEFAIILPHLKRDKNLSNSEINPISEISYPGKLSKRIIETLAQPLTILNNTHYISSSIGIAVYPENGVTPYEILKNADTAMYAAKREGKGRFKYCTEEMTTKMLNLLELEMDIRTALHKSQFVLHFQPQVELATKEIIGLEALIRWHHPTRGIILPGDFIPIAEDRGLIQEITKWVIQDVFKQLKSWQDAGHNLVPVMINLSARDFLLKGIDDYIFDLLKRNEKLQGLFGVEVTETAIMDDRDKTVAILNRMRGMGIKIALDDFGSGYSSMNYLQFLPVDTVKIDRSFIKNITQSSKNAAITEAIISMSHTLNFKVLAEGVETLEQYEYLRSIQCDQAQGYFFYKPLLAREIGDFLGKAASIS